MSGEAINIVSGLPRSGTSLMMQMIHAGGIEALTDGARARDEDNPRGYYELEAVKGTRQDPSWLDGAGGKVVKMVHLLLMDLPADRPYRVVFMRRELAEVVRSQAVMLDRRGTTGAKLTPEQLIKAYERQLARVEQWLAGQPGFELHDVNYNELVAEPRPVAEAVNRFLGGSLDVEAMLGCVDPSLYRQRAEARR